MQMPSRSPDVPDEVPADNVIVLEDEVNSGERTARKKNEVCINCNSHLVYFILTLTKGGYYYYKQAFEDVKEKFGEIEGGGIRDWNAGNPFNIYTVVNILHSEFQVYEQLQRV